MRRSGLVLGLPMACAASLQVSAYAEPIAISTIEELQRIANDPACPLDGDYVLTKGIDASATASWNEGAGFEPIGGGVGWGGPAHQPPNAERFTGTFDGQGHALTGLHIRRPDETYVGLFGAMGEGGVVRNLGVEGSLIVGGSCVGGLVGLNTGTVSQCYATGAVTGTGSVGGLVRRNYEGRVEASFWDIETTGTDSSDGGVGLPTEPMQTRSTFTDAGWDFDAVWGMVDGETYPYLLSLSDDRR